MLDRVAVASEDEAKHFKLMGTAGAGKSSAMRELLNTALERGGRAVLRQSQLLQTSSTAEL